MSPTVLVVQQNIPNFITIEEYENWFAPFKADYSENPDENKADIVKSVLSQLAEYTTIKKDFSHLECSAVRRIINGALEIIPELNDELFFKRFFDRFNKVDISLY